MNRGIQEFYYSKKVPDRGVKIAGVKALPSNATGLVDVNNIEPPAS